MANAFASDSGKHAHTARTDRPSTADLVRVVADIPARAALARPLGLRLFAGSLLLGVGLMGACAPQAHADDLRVDVAAGGTTFVQDNLSTQDREGLQRAWGEAMQLSVEAWQQGNQRRALRSAETAMDIAINQLKNNAMALRAAEMLGQMHEEMGNWADMAGTYQTLLDQLPTTGEQANALRVRCLVRITEAQAKDGRPEEALTTLGQALDKANLKDQPQMWLGLADARIRMAMSLQRLPDAETFAQDMLKRLGNELSNDNPIWMDAWNVVADTHLALSAHDASAMDQAIKAKQARVDWALGHDKNKVDEARLELAAMTGDAGRWEQAAAIYQDTIDALEPPTTRHRRELLIEALLGMAEMDLDLNHLPQAIEHHRKAADLQKQLFDREGLVENAWTTAHLFGLDYDHASAEAALDDAASIVQPGDDGHATLQLARALMLTNRGEPGDAEQAKTLFDSALEGFQQAETWDGEYRTLTWHTEQADWAISRGEFDEALDWMAKAQAWLETSGSRLAEIPGLLDQFTEPIEAHMLAGRYEQAIAVARKQVKSIGRLHGERSPEAADARALLARALAQSGQADVAFATYQQALDLLAPMGQQVRREKSWLLFNLGRQQFNVGQYDDALANLEQAQALVPDDYKVFFIACCHLGLGQQDQAMASLSEWEGKRTPFPGMDWPHEILSMIQGNKTSDELAQIARQKGGASQARMLCETYFYLAMKTAAEGHTKLANKYLMACKAQNVYQFIEWESARQLLSRGGMQAPPPEGVESETTGETSGE